MKKFSIWLEEKDYITDAVLGVFGGDSILGDSEKRYIMSRNTNEFSNEILNNFLNLGVLKSSFENNPNKMLDIKNMVKNGILIKDLIDKVRGQDFAPNAKIEN
jgi:hypothetical protein